MIRFLGSGTASAWMGKPARKIMNADMARHQLCTNVALDLLKEWKGASNVRK